MAMIQSYTTRHGKFYSKDKTRWKNKILIHRPTTIFIKKYYCKLKSIYGFRLIAYLFLLLKYFPKKCATVTVNDHHRIENIALPNSSQNQMPKWKSKQCRMVTSTKNDLASMLSMHGPSRSPKPMCINF
jgi:hypothetical protein